jgi:hypothetical protein
MDLGRSASRAVAHHVTQDNPTGSVSGVLARLRLAVRQQPQTDKIALRHLLIALEQNSFVVILLVFALLLVSPLSAIPGATTLFGLTIASVVGQVFLGRHHIWLPGILLNRVLPVHGILQALQWLEKPAAWLDQHLRARLLWVIEPPLAMTLKGVVFAAALCAPLMEVIPASGTSVGAAITLFTAGLMARDGVFVLLGACLAAILPVTLWIIIG